MRQIMLAVTVGVALCGVMGAIAAESSSKPAASAPATSASASSAEAQKVLKAFDLWGSDHKREAVDALLNVNWEARLEFPSTAHFFVMSEPQLASLPAEEREKITEGLILSAKAAAGLASEMRRMGTEAMAEKDFPAAEKDYLVNRRLGRLLSRQDKTLFVRLVGISIQGRALNNMAELYQAMNKPEQVKAAQDELGELKQQQELTKKEIGAIAPSRPAR